MKIAAVALAVALMAVSACSFDEKPAAADLSDLRAAVKEIKLLTPEGKLQGICSAVQVGKHTLLTAAHCDVGGDLYVNGFRAVVLKKDVERDLLLLHVAYGVGCPCIPYWHLNPDVDTPVVEIGFPLNAGQVLTDGRYQSEDKRGFILYTAPTTWGNSGGGVFVHTPLGWMLAGIVSRGTVVPYGGMIPIVITHLNYASGGSNISAFMHGES